MPSDPASRRAFLTLGSNIEPGRHLPRAVQELSSLGEVAAVSSVWESAPVGFIEQPRFCNAAVLLLTTLDPVTLKQKLRDIEDRLGRVRDPLNKNAPRTIDLDIAFYEDQVRDEPRLPDPDIVSRNFLAVPLAELAPDFAHPVLKTTLEELARQSGGADGLVRRDDIPLQAISRASTPGTGLLSD